MSRPGWLRRPGSLRARITLAAVGALALAGLLAGIALLAAIERDGRQAVDEDLRQRAERLVHRVDPPGRFGRRPPPGGGDEGLLAGADTFVQVAYRGEVVEQRGDVPLDPPALPENDGLSTVETGGGRWRALTFTPAPDEDVRFQILSSLGPVEDRVADTRRLVLLIGLAALALTGLAAWGFTTLAVAPLARLQAGAARVGSADSLATPLPDDAGPDEVRSLARTLNEMLARLRASTEAMQRALEATRRFAADAGHELRTPLTGLRANLDALERNPDLPGDQRAALVREMVAEQDRVVHLLGGLQALARGDAVETLRREQVELADLVDAAVYEARRRHPAITFELVEEIGDTAVQGWADGLRLLIDNLLDNAALHGRPAGRVRVGLARAEETLAITVDDDGPGIPPADAERVLEPFARGERAQAPGTGLGLAIVAQQVALHGGTLALDRSDLGGLGVRVSLPCAPE